MHPSILKEARDQVEALIRDFPELESDANLRADVIEGQSTFFDVMRQLVVEVQVAKDQIEGMAASQLALKLRQSRIEKRRERLRSTMLYMMQAAGLDKMKLPEASLSVTHKEPEPVEPTTLDGVPEQFIKTNKILRWKELKAAIIEAPADYPEHRWSNGGTTLTIRTA